MATTDAARGAAHSGIEVCDGLTVADLTARASALSAELAACLEPERLSAEALRSLFADLDADATMFEGRHRGGRGDGYRLGQSTSGVRRVAISFLDDLIGPRRSLVLDALAGSGTFARTVVAMNRRGVQQVLCCDIAGDMVAAAYRGGFAAWRQGADRMLIADSCVDAVLFLYGTHHIPRSRLATAMAEASRVLRPGGIVAVQDFEEGTPSARWFSVVLHEWTPQGHDFRHFHRDELASLLRSAGFAGVQEHRLYDPLELHGTSEALARAALFQYVATTWEFGSLLDQPGGRDRLWEFINAYGRCEPGTVNPCEFTSCGVRQADGDVTAVMPRMSLLAWGVKPGGGDE